MILRWNVLLSVLAMEGKSDAADVVSSNTCFCRFMAVVQYAESQAACFTTSNFERLTSCGKRRRIIFSADKCDRVSVRPELLSFRYICWFCDSTCGTTDMSGTFSLIPNCSGYIHSTLLRSNKYLGVRLLLYRHIEQLLITARLWRQLENRLEVILGIIYLCKYVSIVWSARK